MSEEYIPQMLTLKEASKKSGLTYNCLRMMCLNNQIVFIKAGSKFLINFGKLCEYLNGGESSGKE